MLRLRRFLIAAPPVSRELYVRTAGNSREQPDRIAERRLTTACTGASTTALRLPLPPSELRR